MRNGASSTTIRISRETHDLLKRIASQQSESMQNVLDAALAKYRQYIMMSELNEDFAKLRKDKQAWKEELEERKLWDRTIGDGLAKD